MTRPRIVLCLRNQLFSDCLSDSIHRSQGFSSRSVAPEAILTTLNQDLPSFEPADLLLLDSEISRDTVENAIVEIRRSLPDCKVLLFVSEHSLGRIVELARLGGNGCLFENIPVRELLDAISHVLAGQSFCSPQLANSLLAQIGRMDQGNPWSQHLDGVQLTSREREILGMISRERLGNKQIARHLNVSLYTIKNHVHNIIDKLGAQDRYDAAEIARGRKLLTTPRTGAKDPACV